MNILLAVEGCLAHADRFEIIMDTWGSESLLSGATMQFFTGARLGVPDDYLSLPLKTKAICKWSREHDYDHTLICDTDAYISIPRALASGFEHHDYSGYVQTWLAYPYCSGPSYWLSKKACEALALADWKHYAVKDHETDEDVMVGSVLYQRGFRYHHDHRYVNPAGVLPDNNVISEHITFHVPYTHEEMYKRHRRACGNNQT